MSISENKEFQKKKKEKRKKREQGWRASAGEEKDH